MKKEVRFYSLLPALKNEIGHNYPYTLSVSKAATLNGWQHRVLLPKNCSINNLPSFWEKNLACSYGVGQNTKRERLSHVVRNFFPFLKFLRALKKNQEGKKILFLEHFGLLDLPLLFFTFLLSRPKINLWLFYRFSSEDFGKKIWVFKWFHFLLKTILGKKQLKLLTDSEIIASKLKTYFGQDLKVMPIPHTTCIADFQNLALPKDKNLFWWPGGLIREEKGLKQIQIISKKLNKSNHSCKLYVAEKAKRFLQTHEKLIFVKNDLNAKEYAKLMNRAGLVLLPYFKENYQSRTSGIFVEAVIAGSLPAVTAGTWMAYELNRFDLSELIIDWARKDLLEYLAGLHKNKIVQKKFIKMQTHYLKYHSVKNYAEAMRLIAT